MRSFQASSLRLGLFIALAAPFAIGQLGIGPITTGVKFAKKRIGHPPSTIAEGFGLQKIVTGSDALENPSGPDHPVRCTYGWNFDRSRRKYISGSRQQSRRPRAGLQLRPTLPVSIS